MAGTPKVVFVTGDADTKTVCEEIIRHNLNFQLVNVAGLAKVSEDNFNLVPSKALVDMIHLAMNKTSEKHFVITHFPRSVEDADAFEQKTGVVPKLVLFFTKKDFKPLQDFSGHSYDAKGLLKCINAALATEKLSERIKALLSPFVQEELLELSEQLLNAIDSGDYETYKILCDDELTAFEPESQGQLIEGLPFHKFYFDMRNSGGKFIQRISTIAAPKVVLLSEDAALVTYTRLMQGVGTPLAGYVDSYNETRVWKRKIFSGKNQWKNVHFHRSRSPTVPEFYTVTTTTS